MQCQERGRNEPVKSLVRVRYVAVEGGMYSSAIMSVLRPPQATSAPPTWPKEDIPMELEGGGWLPSQLHPTSLKSAASPSTPPIAPSLAVLCPDAASKAVCSQHHVSPLSSSSSSSSLTTVPSQGQHREKRDDYRGDDAWLMPLLVHDGLEAASSPGTSNLSSISWGYAPPTPTSPHSAQPHPTAWNTMNPSMVPGEGVRAGSHGVGEGGCCLAG